MILATCRRCGVEWEPDRSDYIRRTWQLCPACRDDREPEGMPAPEEPDPDRTAAKSEPVDRRRDA